MSEDNKKFKIVSGDGENLDISPVYEHLNSGKPNCDDKPKNIVIPNSIKDENSDDKDDDTNVEKESEVEEDKK